MNKKVRFGKKVDGKVIAYLEKEYEDIPEGIIIAIAKHKPYTKSDRNKIYKSIKKLKDLGILIKGNKSLHRMGDHYYEHSVFPKPKSLKIDTENEYYKLYKRRQSTFNDFLS